LSFYNGNGYFITTNSLKLFLSIIFVSSLSYLTPDEKYYQGLEYKYYDAKKIFLNAA